MALLTVENRNSMEEKSILMMNVSSSSLSALDPFQRSLTMSSQESIQLWIDSLSEGDVPDGIDEEIEAMTAKALHIEEHRAYLTIGESEDDLALGAEAKTLGSSPSGLSVSPRISPLPMMDRDDEPLRPRLQSGKGKESDLETEELTSSPSISHARSFSMSSPLFRRPLSARYSSLDSEVTHDSVIDSVYGLRSMLGTATISPEEMLLNLGFCDKEESPLARIPQRFLQARSSAAGIDVDQFLDENIDVFSEDSALDETEVKGRALLSRFSQSSIDLSSVDSDLYVSRRKRKSSVPTILIDPSDEQESVSKGAPPKGSNIPWSKLSTLEEEFEPPYTPRNPWRSPRSSVCWDRRPSLQRQKSIDIPAFVGDNGSLRKGISGSSSTDHEERSFIDRVSKFSSPQSSFDNEERRARIDAAKKSFSAEMSLEVVDERKREEDAVTGRSPPSEELSSEVSNDLDNASKDDSFKSEDELLFLHDEIETDTQNANPSPQVNTIQSPNIQSPNIQSPNIQSPKSSTASPNSKDSPHVGRIEEKINHLRSLLKLDTPLSNERKPDLVGLNADHNNEKNQALKSSLDQSERCISEDCAEKSPWSSLPDIVDHQKVGSFEESKVDQQQTHLEEYPEVLPYSFDNIKDSSEETEAASKLDVDGNEFRENHSVIAGNGTDDCVSVTTERQNDVVQETTCLNDQQQDNSSLDLLEKLNSSRYKLRNSMTNQRRGSGQSRRGLSTFISLPNIYDLPSASKAAKEFNLCFRQKSEGDDSKDSMPLCFEGLESKESSENTCLESHQSNIQENGMNGESIVDNVDGHRSAKSAQWLLSTIRREIDVTDSVRLDQVGKKESKESDQTYVQEQFPDNNNEPNGQSSADRATTQPVETILRTPRVVVSSSDSNDSNNNESDDTQKYDHTSLQCEKSHNVHTTQSPLLHMDNTAPHVFRHSELDITNHDYHSNKEIRTLTRTEAPVSIVDRTKARMLPKGYSIDSSGFEDESEVGRASPDKSEKGSISPSLSKMTCHLCQDPKLTSPGHTPSSLTSAPDVVLGNDMIYRHDSKDYVLDISNTQCKYCLHDTSDDLADLNVLCLDHDHFDFLAQQLSSIKQDMKKQEERLKQYVDEQLEWKSEAASLHHEIDALKAELADKENENKQLKQKLQGAATDL